MHSAYQHLQAPTLSKFRRICVLARAKGSRGVGPPSVARRTRKIHVVASHPTNGRGWGFRSKPMRDSRHSRSLVTTCGDSEGQQYYPLKYRVNVERRDGRVSALLVLTCARQADALPRRLQVRVHFQNPGAVTIRNHSIDAKVRAPGLLRHLRHFCARTGRFKGCPCHAQPTEPLSPA
jgi:hypothetical protein